MDNDLEAARSAVRRRVTYWVVFGFLLFAGGMIAKFMYDGSADQAEAIFGQVVALTGPIVGFWFGSRKPEPPKEPASE